MIVPSIDIVRGRAVQLIGGETEAIDAGDPQPILEKFSLAGEVAVIDIDAARGEGNNRDLIRNLCRRAPIRVGGGIRDVETALDWLDAGAAKVIIGTAAAPEVLTRLPSDRVIAALDSRNGEVVTHGWREGSGQSLFDRISLLNDVCAGFLVTFVELEGQMRGTDLERARAVIAAAGDSRVTIAGGITTAEEIAEIDRLGADSQVGMALYSGRLSVARAIAAPLESDRADGLWPTVVVDDRGTALGLAWSSAGSLERAVEGRRGVYQSRSRGVWEKGETSGSTQELLKIDLDCDRDALRFTVRQHGSGFCHLHTRTCWGKDGGLSRLSRRISSMGTGQSLESNTARLLGNPGLLRSKLREEADELASATSREDVIAEAADLLYFTLVKAAASGVGIEDIEEELERRSLRLRRRPMQPKPEYAE